MKQWNRITMWTAAALLTAGLAAQAAYVVLPDGRKIEGTEIRMTSAGDVSIATAQGRVTFTKGQYITAMGDRPPEMDGIAKLIQAKQYDEAITKLEDVITRNRGLGWDAQARFLQARVYKEKGDAATAIATIDKLFVMSPKSKEDGEIMWFYREALMAGKQYDKLETALAGVIATGSRSDAARAQIMRGDAKLAQGQAELAALDYMRTMVLFKDAADRQAEATFKAAQALEQSRDARAKELYKKVATEYSSSPYAAAARGKM